MKCDYTARRSRPFAASASAPSCSVLLRHQTKHSVTDRSLRSPSHIHHSATIGVADDVAAPVHIHIHTHRSNTPRREYNDHSRRPEFPAQEIHGQWDPVPTLRRGGVTL